MTFFSYIDVSSATKMFAISGFECMFVASLTFYFVLTVRRKNARNNKISENITVIKININQPYLFFWF